MPVFARAVLAPAGPPKLGPPERLRGLSYNQASATTPRIAIAAITITAIQKIEPRPWIPKFPITSRVPRLV